MKFESRCTEVRVEFAHSRIRNPAWTSFPVSYRGVLSCKVSTRFVVAGPSRTHYGSLSVRGLERGERAFLKREGSQIGRQIRCPLHDLDRLGQIGPWSI